MINREIIRLKVLQITYAYYQNGGKNVDTAEKEFFFSLAKTYDLYNYLLLLIVDISHIAARKVETAQNKFERTGEGEAPSRKFIENRFLLQLIENKQLVEFQKSQKKNWDDQEDFVRAMYEKIVQSDIYKAYMESEVSSYDEDRELWRKLYKTIFFNNDDIDSALEDMSLYWNDDKEIVDTFVLKTIKRFDPKKGKDQELLPEFKDEEDRAYAHKLFRATLLNAEYYRQLMSENTRNWDFNRLALMDVVIMQIALAEILTFPNIPLNVSLNEYVGMARLYSTSRSGQYVNGLLDHICKRLIEEKKLIKK